VFAAALLQMLSQISMHCQAARPQHVTPEQKCRLRKHLPVRLLGCAHAVDAIDMTWQAGTSPPACSHVQVTGEAAGWPCAHRPVLRRYDCNFVLQDTATHCFLHSRLGPPMCPVARAL
jgi:hypothetical protein